MLCCKENTLGDGDGGLPHSVSGMEVEEVTEGKGTTYGFTLSVWLHIGFLLCVVGCVTWLGTILQMGSQMGFKTWFGFAIHLLRHALLL